MKIKLRDLLLLLMITNFSDFMCMENTNVFSQKEADEQLLNIICSINLDKVKACSIAYNGERTVSDGYDNVFTYGGKSMYCGACFTAKPIEEAVLAHRDKKLLLKPKYHYQSYIQPDNNKDQYLYTFASTNCNVPVAKSITSLKNLALSVLMKQNDKVESLLKSPKLTEDARKQILNYLLYNPKAPKIRSKKKLIEKYPPDEIPTHECFINLNKNFRAYLEKKFPGGEHEKKLEEIEHRIEAYLNKGGNILLPLSYCILAHDRFFSDSSYPSANSIKLATWLLKDKEGWYYLDELLARLVSNESKESKEFHPNEFSFHFHKLFIRCLTLIHNYHTFETAQKRMNNILCKIARTRKIYLMKSILHQGLATQESLNNAFLDTATFGYGNYDEIKMLEILKEAGANNLDITLLALGKKCKKNYYIGIYYTTVLNQLLNWGADPNILFYCDEQEKRRCYLQYPYDCTKLLARVLLHPKRIPIDDEPSDFDYLNNEYLNSIQSIFYNNQNEGQQNLYNYAMRVYELAFEAQKTKKTEDLQKLRQYIIDYDNHQQHKQGIVAKITNI